MGFVLQSRPFAFAEQDFGLQCLLVVGLHSATTFFSGSLAGCETTAGAGGVTGEFLTDGSVSTRPGAPGTPAGPSCAQVGEASVAIRATRISCDFMVGADRVDVHDPFYVVFPVHGIFTQV